MNAARRVIVPLEISPEAPALGAAVHTLQGRSMGTSWCVKLSGPRRIDAPALQEAIQGELDAVVAQMSPWDAASDISRCNRADVGSWHTLPPEFAHVMACAMQIAAASGGAFDPSAGALVDLWGFGPPGPVAHAPAEEAIAEALAHAGWQRLRFEGGRLQQPGGATLDLSAIAKGFGVDQVARMLSARGIDNHLVEVGGELRGTGIRPDGQPWWVDLQRPPGAEALPETRVALHGLAVATSGDYLRRFSDGGVSHSHTLDPRTGRPITHGLASVSVLHADCMLADAWSTALTVLGTEQGLACAREHGLAALFVQRALHGWAEHLSPALEAMAA